MNKTPDCFCAALVELNAVYQEKSADSSNPHSRGVADGLDIAESIFTKHANNAPTEQAAWISVKEKLPEKDGEYIVVIKDGRKISISSKPYKKEKGFLRYMASMNEVITHWQPLPEPPKGK